MITNSESGTNITEVAEGIYRINTRAEIPGGNFSFNQYLIVDDEPLLFHTGPKRFSDVVLRAVATVMPLSRLRYVAYSHCESDECGGMPELLASSNAVPVTGAIGAMLNSDLF